MKHVVVSVALLSMSSLATSAYADCYAYEDINFGGAVAQVSPGVCFVFAAEGTPTDKCDGKAVNYFPEWDNQISSIKTDNGSKYTFFHDVSGPSAGGSGQSEVPDVGNSNNDKISVIMCD